MFERWSSNPRFPTLKKLYRTVYVDMNQALPGCVGGLVKNRNITLRAEGLRLEAWMRGHQIAWIRTHDLHWIAVVQVEAHSENEMSSVTMTLWLPPKMFQLDKPEGFYEPYRRRL
ncbi:Uncharacterised protein [Mycobacteroides abscessus subsp. bolletii]|uniref:Uncharacterized protein n=1 Tax=Mycobacteroides abscessus subsp. bolletii 50594 TaxID=1303024 RepID=A0AB33A933_9MYCO|nr:hypothetical protein [Mycobacteroides abscessus]QSM03915.1 hypothetical protein PROPHIGD91-2_62 [Mycobacterium phage prophiGD91-2]AGM28169.1 hypothetical protein MASS_1567 [Mycobacteroides abscessus subsp. bolletii 50594]QSM90520.1 hypothetical protein I3U44_07575 [Mycobacteroides abscessus subsp. bolletii]QSM90804.1 hypothetical protein I3U44_09210 [Mycobacteroides abscessus subsp. bolletii]SHQ62862.1 Uncharacterised protein [Mycobacteroides abscessus subsp. bolletii]